LKIRPTFERVRVPVAQPVPQLDDLALAVRQRLQDVLDLVLEHLVGRRVHRGLDRVVLDEVAEVAVLALPDRAVEADRVPADLQNPLGFFDTGFGGRGHLLDRWLPAELLDQLLGHVPQLGHGLDHVHRDADRPGLVGDGPGDRLADPPGCVGRELVPPLVLVLVHRPHQPGVPLLDQVQERQAPVAVLLGDRDDQPQVPARQLPLGLLVLLEPGVHHVDALPQAGRLLQGQPHQVAELGLQVGPVLLLLGRPAALEPPELLLDLRHPGRDLLHLLHERLDLLRPDAQLFDQRDRLLPP